MKSSLGCITGKEKLPKGNLWCQECNGFHEEKDTPKTRNHSIRTVAFMLRNDEITPRDAALVLFLLTEPVSEKHHFHHD